MRLKVCIIISLMSLSGCVSVSNKPISSEESTKLLGKSLSPTKYEIPNFLARTAGSAGIGVLGLAMMISDGNNIVKTNNIPDPAISISMELMEMLAGHHNMKIITGNNSVIRKDNLTSVISTYGGVDYLVDVKTVHWMFEFYPENWIRYRVVYAATLRLIDTNNKSVVAETLCRSTQGDDKNPPSKTKLIDNNAELLKSYLNKAAADCIEVFSKDILKL